MSKILLLILAVFTASVSEADTLRVKKQIEWAGVQIYQPGTEREFQQLYFSGAQYSMDNPSVPVFSEIIALNPSDEVMDVFIEQAVYGIPEEDAFSLLKGSDIADTIQPVFFISYERNNAFLTVTFIPLRKNSYNGLYEQLESVELVVITRTSPSAPARDFFDYANESVLGSGSWYKLSVREDGVYRITYSDLQAMGLDPQSIDPRNIRLYGNGGGMLPESLAAARQDDLRENAIRVIGENDGKFNQGDYILFYGQAPDRWKLDPAGQHFNHVRHLYSDFTYYFLTADLGPGKRISPEPSINDQANVSVSKFTDYAFHEHDRLNLINAGRVWYGEVFDIKTSYDTTYIFPDLDLSGTAYFKAYVAAKSGVSSTFRFYEGSQQILTGVVNGILPTSETYARNFIGSAEFTPSSSSLKIKIEYQKPTSSASGWLNYFELNVVRNLRFTGPQLTFRAPQAIGAGNIAEFSLASAGEGVTIWDVTDPCVTKQLQALQNGGSKQWRVEHDSLREFIAWDGTSFLTAGFVEKISNQNLHSLNVPEMLIISHESFMPEAERLAQFHRDMDGMSVEVVDVQKIYNEFSSGAQDVSAIRNLVKMLMDKDGGAGAFQYLLLFGDASFDYKDRIANNSNYVPTWLAEESLTIVYSIASDDYYGFLDGPSDNLLDIGIGRLPVETPEQATQMVDKIIHYATYSERVMHDWRNVVTFVADDDDGNMHLDQAEEMATFLDTNYGVYNVDKIYVDAFPQFATAGGQRAPDVNKAINSRISKGTLIMNYTGHGGEVGWGHERFLEISDINTWKNHDKLPIFITATCEFSRYDDPERLSAGEMVFRNPKGGAIAMFTTARATFGGSNFNLNQALFDVMFEKNDGEAYRFGDMIRIAKNKNGVVANDNKFVLLGDPALKLAVPEHQVRVTSINGIAISPDPDTLRALSTVNVSGEVTDESGLRITDFNGTLYSIVFDKPSKITTLMTDEGSRPAVFDLQNNTLYKGKAQVVNGQFEFSFIVPKDIAYNYGFGKMSFYAASDDIDAHGFYRNLVIGGFNPDAPIDNDGPEITLFMNDPMFQSGGITDENPILLAFVSDESGINTVGSGIGHDIVAVLDGNTEKPIILNEYYEAELNSYTRGTVAYPFLNLSPGFHTLSVKIWDVFNNSSEDYLEFVVDPSGNFIISHLINYPNPFNWDTYFIFDHNQAENEMDVVIRIYSLTGQIVKVIEETVVPAGYRSTPIYWNGCDEGGFHVAKGAYLYRLTVSDSQGRWMENSGTLIKLD